MLLLPLFLYICYAVVSANLEDFLRLPLMNTYSALTVVGSSLSQLLWKAAGVLLVWGAIDLMRQRSRFNRDLKMTKQEVREEYKQNDGNPEVKMKIRRMRRDLLRRQHDGGGSHRHCRHRQPYTFCRGPPIQHAEHGNPAGGCQGKELPGAAD